jgi:hypothetical protein
MKLDPSIIALKDFKLIEVFRLKLARYSTANSGPEYKRKCINPFLGFFRFIHNMYVWLNFKTVKFYLIKLVTDF